MSDVVVPVYDALDQMSLGTAKVREDGIIEVHLKNLDFVREFGILAKSGYDVGLSLGITHVKSETSNKENS